MTLNCLRRCWCLALNCVCVCVSSIDVIIIVIIHQIIPKRPRDNAPKWPRELSALFLCVIALTVLSNQLDMDLNSINEKKINKSTWWWWCLAFHRQSSKWRQRHDMTLIYLKITRVVEPRIILETYTIAVETFLFVSVHKWTVLHAALIQKNKTNEVAEKLHLI